MTTTEYIENIAIPALNEEKTKGYTRSAICVGTQFDAVKVGKGIEQRTDFKCTACGGTVYVKMI